jgi:predicted MFS family arabinose efflux permease
MLAAMPAEHAPVVTTAPRLGRPIALLSAAAFASAATMRVADPLVPQVAQEMAVTPGAAGVMVTAFALAYGCCQLLWGRLGDRLGKFRVVTAMTLLSGLTVALAALADSIASLALARLLSGATAAALIPLSMAFIGDHVPYAERQAAIARYLSGQILGLVAGQVMGGVIGDTLGWRAVFLVLAAVYLGVGGLLALELWRGRLARAVPQPRRRLLDGLMDLARNRWVRVVLLVVLLEGGLFFGAFAYVGAHLHAAFALAYTEIGLLLGAFGLGGLAFALAVRRLVTRLGERGLATTGGVLIAAGFLLLAAASAPWLVAPAVGIIGLGFYMLHNTLQTHATQMAPEARGLAVGAFASCFFLGQAAGAWLVGRLGDRLGFAPLLAVAGVLLLALALAFARALGRHRAGRTA